ncbi:MAG: hypothetical protein ACK4NY_24410 [Spirosomataceae bacterium]
MLKRNRQLRLLSALFLLIHLLTVNVYGQEYGLEFFGHEVVTDKRTALVLGDELICTNNNLELAFELKFKPKVSSYFGYVFKIITEDDKNIDLLFQSDSQGKVKTFRIISGDKDIKLTKSLDSTTLYSQWNQFKISIKDNQLAIFCNGNQFGSGQIPFEFKKCFRVYFGECSNPKFLTSDVLPMYLRNVVIKSGEKALYHWQLNEVFGPNSIDKIGHREATTKNAQWLLKNHYEWRLLKKIRFKGNSSFSFDPNSKKIIVSSDLKTYFFNTQNDSLIVKNLTSTHRKFTFGDIGIFLKKKNKLVNIRLNEKQLFTYETTSNTWDIAPDQKYSLTEYWHHNKYVYPQDSAIVLIGGYGQYKYKNRFQKYSFQTKSWVDLKLSGDELDPRYMFGLGNKSATKSFIFGGFGSKTGDQGLNPQNYYDLLEIDWQKNSIKKIYDLKVPEQPFAVASSLIYDEKNDSFYGLIYNQLKFNTSLQLIEGSLSKPEIKPISKEIPYRFLDVASFADLYFDKENSKLFCVTSFHDRNPIDSTEINIYSLEFPPTNVPAEALQEGGFMQKVSKIALYVLPVLVIVFLVGVYLARRKPKPTVASQSKEIQVEETPKVVVVAENENNDVKGKVLLFGGFQFLDVKGADLTNQFTPLLKEMFLYLLLNSIKWNKGVNSTQLNEMFWYDKTTSSARNNRSVNITKLKTIFEQLTGIEINKDTGNWKIVFDPSLVYIDYFEFQKLTNSKKQLNSEQIRTLTEIVNRGSFLSSLEYEWLDDFKGEISNRVIDTYLAYSEKLELATHAEEIVEIADSIFKFDSVDETAMSLKCRALVHLGKHSLAKSCYERFAKDYHRLYSEEYGVLYKEVLEG